MTDTLQVPVVTGISFEEFLGLGADVHGDWIDGQARLQVQGETDRHADVLGFVAALMRTYVGARHGGRALLHFQMRPSSHLPSREVDLLYLAPDGRGRLRESFVDGPADLVVEVVSDESRRRDREQKLREYEAGGVRECWLVDTVLELTPLPAIQRDAAWRNSGSPC